MPQALLVLNLQLNFLNVVTKFTDNHNDYYDVSLKEQRIAGYLNHDNYTHLRLDISNKASIEKIFFEYWYAEARHKFGRPGGSSLVQFKPRKIRSE